MQNKTLVYFYTYRTNIKERWKNRALIEVLVDEFKTRPREYFEEAINCGVITINDKIVSIKYKLKLVDFMKHTVHLHEPCMSDIRIIKRENGYVVVDKPAGVPCHPTGGYIEYSVTKKIFGSKTVACVNRLDMPVSGVMIIATDNLKENIMKISDTEKVYVAKVMGKFYDAVDCTDKIFCEKGRKRFVDNDRGKKCHTKFKLIEYKNGYSLVECRPITGRTHQIRIHLQSLGFSILNDLIYGNAMDTTDCDKETSQMFNEDFYKPCTTILESDVEKEKMECILKYCKGENNRSFDFKNKHICLHAWKYKYNDTWYESNWPEWAKLN